MKFHEFVTEICEYESDTFSATGESLSSEESEKIAEAILDNIMNNEVDGVWLSGILRELRDKEEDANTKRGEEG